MLICHKLVVSNDAAGLQACHMSDAHATGQQPTGSNLGTRQCVSCQHSERLCAAERLIQSYLSLLVSQTAPLCSAASPPPPLGDAVVVPMKTACMRSK